MSELASQVDNRAGGGRIISINGQVVKATGPSAFKMLEAVRVGGLGLIGEVIKVNSEVATIQVYEVTTGLRVGEPVEPTGRPLSITLGPGLVSNFFDGIQRPLAALEKASGPFIGRGVEVTNLDMGRKWQARVLAKEGEFVAGGQVVAEVQETPSIAHRVMVPPDVSGKVTFAAPDGAYALSEPIVRVSTPRRGEEASVTLAQQWPIRRPRPIAERVRVTAPLVTGQRVIDSFFPIAKGGTAAIPGSFGTGKTMAQHQVAKWSDADLIVYIGCGERGNEMTEVLEDFPKLLDPRTNRSLMERTILIANTSNMPVAAREASIYTGITIAEYYRDMGYNVAVMADSTSRWAEALREISGRLEEMPAEEGFPAYLSSRLSEFYERAGNVRTLGGATGSVSIIGAVSPQGGDFSEPVTQNTQRYIRCFWALDRQLAYARHYPAINWITSYSEYLAELEPWYKEHVHPDFMRCRNGLMRILQEESKLQDIVKLVGSDILADEQKLTLETGAAIRLGFLQQAAFHAVDTFVPPDKQYRMMDLILFLHGRAEALVRKGVPMSEVRGTGVFEMVVKVKFDIPNDAPQMFDALKERIGAALDALAP
jgi:V/A-type H+-transporting ATPase subunit A